MADMRNNNVSIKFSDAELAALEAAANERGVTKAKYIRDALEAYGDFAIDESELTKFKKFLKYVLNLDDVPHLVELIDSRIFEVLKGKFIDGVYKRDYRPEELAPRNDEVRVRQTVESDGDYQETTMAQEGEPDHQAKVKTQDGSIDKLKLCKEAIQFIVSGLETGKDVIVSDVAKHFDVDNQIIGTVISSAGVKAKRKQLFGVRERYYAPDMIDELKEACSKLK